MCVCEWKRIFVTFMKQIFVIVILGGLLLQTFSKGLVLAEFSLNKEYISRVLCINKSRPKMHCDGHCVLMKKMEQQEKKDHSGNSVTEKFEILIAQTASQLLLRPEKAVRIRPAYLSDVPSRPLHAVFHPPKA